MDSSYNPPQNSPTHYSSGPPSMYGPPKFMNGPPPPKSAAQFEYGLAPTAWHKPPIIIYKGKKPPVHVYMKPTSSVESTDDHSYSPGPGPAAVHSSSSGLSFDSEHTSIPLVHSEHSEIGSSGPQSVITFEPGHNSVPLIHSEHSSSIDTDSSYLPAASSAKETTVVVTKNENASHGPKATSDGRNEISHPQVSYMVNSRNKNGGWRRNTNLPSSKRIM